MTDEPTGPGDGGEVWALVQGASALSGAERAKYLDARCAGRPDLRREVESLLDSGAAAPTFAERTKGTLRSQATAPTALGLAGEAPGQLIGPFKLLEVLGEGGFGVVWLAERREPMVQRVALKIIKPGMDSKAVVARFEQERQALAVLDHPHIAKVFDGGVTPTGRPYFVMEHVQGEPITDFCDRHRYTIRQRLALFIPVCEAVQHAHMKGIIHRDIKPNNILVTLKDEQALPKVIDFGVAKAVSHTLTDKTIFTETGQIIGTPEYMSPEQAEMGSLDIDTRTDVYSLGVVLYELLAGMLPLDSSALRSAGYDAIRKIIREQEAPRPSTRLSTADARTISDINAKRGEHAGHLARELRRELDWIPLKALRKDRRERYSTPADLAKDVRRYLDGEPLEAGPESATYRARKFASRYRPQLVVAAAIALTLIAGLASTLWQAREAHLAAQRATERANAAELAEAGQRRLAEAESAAKRETQEQRARADERAATAEYEAYVANIAAAAGALREDDIVACRLHLDLAPAALRGWEWSYLDAECDRSSIALTSHQNMVEAVDVSPDGKLIASCSRDGDVAIWSAVDGARLDVLAGHPGGAWDVAFSPNGSMLASCGKQVVIRDVQTRAPPRGLEGSFVIVRALSWSPDGHTLAGACQDSVCLWDPETGLLRATLPVPSASRVQYSSDGAYLCATGDTNELRVWWTGGDAPREVIHNPDGNVAAFSPQTPLIAAAARSQLSLWDLRRPQEFIWASSLPNDIVSLAFSGNGTLIAAGLEDGTVCLIAADSGRTTRLLRGHQREVWQVSFAAGDRELISASRELRLWDLDSGHELVCLRGHTTSVRELKLASSDTAVTCSADSTVRLWDLRRRTHVPLPEGAQPVLYGPGSAWVFFRDSLSQALRAFNALDNSTTDLLPPGSAPVSFAALSPTGRAALVALQDNRLLVWQMPSVRPVYDTHLSQEASLSSLIPMGIADDLPFALVASSGSYLICDLRTGRLTRPGLPGRVVGAQICPRGPVVIFLTRDGQPGGVVRAHALRPDDVAGPAVWTHDGKGFLQMRLATDSAYVLAEDRDGTRAIDTATGRELWRTQAHVNANGPARYFRGQMQEIVGYHSYSERLTISGGAGDAVIQELPTGRKLGTLPPREFDLRQFCFGPDNSRVLANSAWERHASLHDPVTGRELIRLQIPGERLVYAGFAPDGDTVIGIGRSGNVWTWNARRNANRARPADVRPERESQINRAAVQQGE